MKCADQLCSTAVTTQLISTFVFLIQKIHSLYFLCDCAGRFMLDLVGNPVDRCSNETARIMAIFIKIKSCIITKFND